MVSDVKMKREVNRSIVFEMRSSGMPLREIAEKIGRSKERVRQILVKDIGTTSHKFLSTLQLCARCRLPRNRIVDLYLDGIIVPAVKWDVGHRDYLLWSFETIEKINAYYHNHRLCKVCNKPLPKNRIFFCTDDCRHEKHKYKYMTPDEKFRVLENIRRYREKRKAETEQSLAGILR
jgi:hypothetical protein